MSAISALVKRSVYKCQKNQIFWSHFELPVPVNRYQTLEMKIGKRRKKRIIRSQKIRILVANHHHRGRVQGHHHQRFRLHCL